jgi:hypothetical protein
MSKYFTGCRQLTNVSQMVGVFDAVILIGITSFGHVMPHLLYSTNLDIAYLLQVELMQTEYQYPL